MEHLIERARPATSQDRCFERRRQHLLSQLVCLGRHTLTGVTATAGGADQDWSAQYRLYSQPRFDPSRLFETVRHSLEQSLPALEPLIVGMDDSLLRKTGTQIPGVAYRKDPLGPKFHWNLVRGQRVLQLSAALPFSHLPWARLIPIDFQLLATIEKPKKSAPSEIWSAYRRACQLHRVTSIGAQRIQLLRPSIDAERPLWIVADGRFTNRTVLKDLPENCTFTGRIRGDAKLYYLPPASPQGPGRRRIYGDQAPTPDQIRIDDSIPWTRIPGYATGRIHQFKVKVIKPLRWRPTSDRQEIQLVVMAPLGYRLRHKGRLLYRQPAYLICTDPHLPVEKILQAYRWRWDIEVNFRDEKTLLGIGQAQVRNPNSVETAPALPVAAYAMLLTAARKAYPCEDPACGLPAPKWSRKKKQRSSTQDLIHALRRDLWAQAISPNFSHFTSPSSDSLNGQKLLPSLHDALLLAPV